MPRRAASRYAARVSRSVRHRRRPRALCAGGASPGRRRAGRRLPVLPDHPALARRYGIADNDSVRMTTRRGIAIVQARLTTTMRLDTVFVPFHWGNEDCVNLLTNPALDPVSKMPEFKVCAVRLEKV